MTKKSYSTTILSAVAPFSKVTVGIASRNAPYSWLWQRSLSARQSLTSSIRSTPKPSFPCQMLRVSLVKDLTQLKSKNRKLQLSESRVKLVWTMPSVSRLVDSQSKKLTDAKLIEQDLLCFPFSPFTFPFSV